MRFSETVWQSTLPIFNKILAHPFLKELSAGSLKQAVFTFYLEQDALYLLDFSRALALTASKFQNAEEISTVLAFAQGILIAERGLHQTYFKNFAVLNPSQTLSPACRAYTQFLLATASLATVEEAMAAVLPCFWIYQAVGQHIYTQSTQDNPYRDWIDMYASEDFNNIVQQAIALTDRLAASTTPLIRDRMQQAFVISTEYEWQFWDSAYRLEKSLI